MNMEIMEEMRELWERLEAMETYRHRDPEVGDVSKPKSEEKWEQVEIMIETPNMRYFRSILGVTSRLKLEFSTYEGSLVAENLID